MTWLRSNVTFHPLLFHQNAMNSESLREGLGFSYHNWASLFAQLIKNPPAMWETWVLSLGWEDPLEKGKATHSSILAWKIPWMEEPGRLQSLGSQRVGHDWVTSLYFTHSSIPTWRIPWTVQSIGLQRVRHDWVTFTSLLHYRGILYNWATWEFQNNNEGKNIISNKKAS